MRHLRVLVTFGAMLVPSVSWAHFPFLHWTTLNDQPVLQVYFAEAPEPSGGQFLDQLVDGKAWMKQAEGSATSIDIKRKDEFLLARPTVKKPVVFGYTKHWGQISRGEETFDLHYYAKTYSGRKAWSIKTGKKLALDIRPSHKDGTLTATAYWKNKPVADAEIVVQGGVDYYEGKTDSKGRFSCKLSDPVVCAIRVRHIEQSPARRHYATATIDLAGGDQ